MDMDREMDPRYLTFHIIFYNIFCFNGYLYEASDPRRLSDHSLLVRRVLLLLSEKSHFLLRVKSQLGWMMSLTIKGWPQRATSRSSPMILEFNGIFQEIWNSRALEIGPKIERWKGERNGKNKKRWKDEEKRNSVGDDERAGHWPSYF